jgi:hypothetical protein
MSPAYGTPSGVSDAGGEAAGQKQPPVSEDAAAGNREPRIRGTLLSTRAKARPRRAGVEAAGEFVFWGVCAEAGASSAGSPVGGSPAEVNPCRQRAAICPQPCLWSKPSRWCETARAERDRSGGNDRPKGASAPGSGPGMACRRRGVPRAPCTADHGGVTLAWCRRDPGTYESV